MLRPVLFVPAVLLASSLLAPVLAAPIAPSSAPLTSPGPVLAPAAWGPPVLCHRLDIGDAESLPFGEGAFGRDPALAREDVTTRTLAVLEASDDAFVHMETVRRAVVLLAHGRLEEEKRLTGELLTALETRARTLAGADGQGDARPARARRAGLAAFDVAWALQALEESGHLPRPADAIEGWVEKALAGRGDDARMAMGVSVLCFAQGEDRMMYEQLEVALADPDTEGLLAENLGRTMQKFLGVGSRRQLDDLVARKLGRA